MAVTLIEAAKRRSGEVMRQAVIEIFAQSSDILANLPFETIAGNALRYNQEGVLPGIGFRGVNEAFTESTGVLNPVTEPLVIAGGDLDVDKFIVDTMGQDQRSAQEAMKIKALAQMWHHRFIKGDTASNPREFDGLQIRLGGTQVLSNGGSSGGDPLSLAKLDEAIDRVDGATHLIMSQAMQRRFTAAARTPGISGTINFVQDQFGRKQTVYQGLPILIADANEIATMYAALGFNEIGTGGGTTATSIYIVSFGSGRLQGIQNGDIDSRDMGELQSAPLYRNRVEWYSGMALMHPRAACRLRDISNAAIVV